jgi:integrase
MPTDPLRPQTKVYQNRAWRKALSDAKITRGIWFYWLRHTFYTTALLEAKLPIQHVSEYGGTSIPTLQRVYLHSDAGRTKSVSGAVRIQPEKGKVQSEE